MDAFRIGQDAPSFEVLQIHQTMHGREGRTGVDTKKTLDAFPELLNTVSSI